MNKFINAFICLIIGFIALFFGFLFINNLSNEFLEKLKVLSYILISFSVMIAILQFRENLKQSKKISDWNKKQITIQQLHNSRKILNDIANYLNNFLNTRRKRPYSVKEIHSLFGVIVNWDKLKDDEKQLLEIFFKGHIQKEDDFHNAGSNEKHLRFIFYKDIGEQNEIKAILERIILTDKQLEELKLESLYYHQSWKNYDGKEFYRKLHNFLSEYEYIATGLNNNIFDIKIIDELMGSGIIQAYKTFSEYIKHLREYHHPFINIKPTIYIQFEKISTIIEERRKN
ncbi:hypothetical protein JCM11957_10400 [Caminibacter profundus]